MIRWPFYPSWRRYATPDSLARWDAWERSQRRKLGFFAGLHIGLDGIARHWPHLLCWSWMLNVERRTAFGWRAWVPFVVMPGYVALGWVWAVTLRWQDYGYMGALGEYADHPEVEWKRREPPQGGSD
jgi:hypothetical protein